MKINSVAFWINLAFGIIEALIGLRIILRLFGANPVAPFVSWVYTLTLPLLVPFFGMFNEPTVGTSQIELSAIFGLVVYALIAYFLQKLFNYFFIKEEIEEEEIVNKHEHENHEHKRENHDIKEEE